jgi:hypothetical protein
MAANWTAFVAGNVLTAAQLNGVVDNFADIAIFNETQSSATDGGTATSGSYAKRTLNTTVVNNISGCSLASSVITLGAGTYQVCAWAPHYKTDRAKSRLRDTTNSADLAVSNTGLASNSYFGSWVAVVATEFTLAGSTDIELQSRVQTTFASQGFGLSAGMGDDEIYSQILIRRIA